MNWLWNIHEGYDNMMDSSRVLVVIAIIITLFLFGIWGWMGLLFLLCSRIYYIEKVRPDRSNDE